MIKHNHSITASEMDVDFLSIIRKDVEKFVLFCSQKYDQYGTLLLDIGPDIYQGAKQFFYKTQVKILDIELNASADYTLDICKNNTDVIDKETFDYVLCTEVLEHTAQPFDAVKEIYRLLKPGGLLFLSVPLNFRIHGPLPDCWRFTQYGLESLLKEFEIIEINAIETPNRSLMPIHYTTIAKKP